MLHRGFLDIFYVLLSFEWSGDSGETHRQSRRHRFLHISHRIFLQGYRLDFSDILARRGSDVAGYTVRVSGLLSK